MNGFAKDVSRMFSRFLRGRTLQNTFAGCFKRIRIDGKKKQKLDFGEIRFEVANHKSRPCTDVV